MAKQLDKQAILGWIRQGKDKIQHGVEIGIEKSQKVSQNIHDKIESNPRAKSFVDNVSRFAHDKSEKILDARVRGVRIGDLPNAAQKLSERQLYRILAKMRELSPDFNWDTYIPDPHDLPVFNAFECLGLPYGTPFEEVKKKYRQLMREYHPDRHTESPEAERAATQKTQEITAAYELIAQHYGK